MTVINATDLTEGTLEGNGTFDVLMRAVKAHIQEEYTRGRLKGAEYGQAYVAAIQAVLDRSLALLLERHRIDLEAQLTNEKIITEQKQQALLDAQAALVTSQKDEVQANIALINQKTTNAATENLILQAQKIKTEKEFANIDAQTSLTAAKELETLANKDLIDQKTTNAVTENLILQAQKTKTEKESANIDAQTGLTAAKELETLANKALVDQKVLNAVTEETVLQGQKCKLDAEFDLLVEQKNRTTTEITKLGSEISLLNQKTLTEKAQVSALGVDTDSVIGRQKSLYAAQADGYKRDAEQKAVKMLLDTWIARYTNDGITTSGTYLDNNNVGKAVEKLLNGVGVTPTTPT